MSEFVNELSLLVHGMVMPKGSQESYESYLVKDILKSMFFKKMFLL